MVFKSVPERQNWEMGELLTMCTEEREGIEQLFLLEIVWCY